MSHSIEYQDRLHSAGWRRLRAFCFMLTWGRCAVLPILPAQELDPLHYCSLGRELPLFDVVPLSRIAHRCFVTPLRAILGRAIVNPALRLAFACWIAFDCWLLYFIVTTLRRLL